MTTSTIGALSVKITADSSELTKGIKQAGTDLVKGRKALNDNAAQFAKWGAAGVTAATAIGAAIFKTTADNVRELKNLSFAANEQIDVFQRGAFAAKQFGIEQDKYGDILKDVQDRIGDFVTTGGGPMVDFFEQVAPKIGITADAFRGLSGQDAMGLFVQSLQDANLSQEEMTFHLEAMASDATMLLPLFQDNAKALKEYSEQAKNLGIGLSSIEATQIEEANKALDEASGFVGAMVQEVAAEFAPLVKALADGFTDAAKEGKGFGDEISLASDIVVNSIGFVMDSVEGVERVFQVLGRTVAITVLGIQEGMLQAADFIVNKPVEAVNELISALNTLPWHNIDPVELTGFGDTIKQELSIVQGAIEIGVDDIADILNAPMPSEGLKAGIAEAKAAAIEVAKIAEEAKAAAGTGGSVVQGTEVVEASSSTQALIDRFATEEQLQKDKYASDQAQLDEALAKKEVSAVKHAELMQALEQENAQKLKEIKAGATEEETAARLEALQNRFASEEELQKEKYKLDQEALVAALANGQIAKDEADLLSQEMAQAHEDAITAIKDQAARLQQQQQLRAMSAGQTLLSLGGKKTEKAVKALAITQAIIKGKTAAVSAFEAGMSTGGPWAPATAALYTAASIANTASMINSIKSGGKSAPRPSGGTRSASGSTSSAAATGTGQAATAQRFDLTLVGSSFTDTQVIELMSKVVEKVADGVEFNVNQN
jgi:hypothetical protein